MYLQPLSQHCSSSGHKYYYSLYRPEFTNAVSSLLLIPRPSSRTQHDHSSQSTPISTCSAPASREFCTSSYTTCGSDVRI